MYVLVSDYRGASRNLVDRPKYCKSSASSGRKKGSKNGQQLHPHLHPCRSLLPGPDSMFSCHSNLRRALSFLVIRDLQTASPEGLLTLATPKTSHPLTTDGRRNHATLASIQKGHHVRRLVQALQSNDIIPPSAREIRHGPSRTSRRNARAREGNRHHLDIQKGEDENDPVWVANLDQALQTELRWTGGDALKLAQTVLDKLKVDDPLRALQLIRESEKMPDGAGKKRADSVVSWNHVMDYFMSKSMTKTAFKIFNEVRICKSLSTGQRDQKEGR